MNQTELHQQECYEAEVRRLRQCLRNLSEAVIAGRERAYPMALAAKILLGDHGKV